MSNFKIGDRVVCINDNVSYPIVPPAGDWALSSFVLPDGPIQKGMIYRIDGIREARDGNPGFFITGKRVLFKDESVTWHSSRFRKVDWKKDYKAHARRKSRPKKKALQVMGTKHGVGQ